MDNTLKLGIWKDCNKLNIFNIMQLQPNSGNDLDVTSEHHASVSHPRQRFSLATGSTYKYSALSLAWNAFYTKHHGLVG